MLSSVSEFNFEVKTRTATRFLPLLLSCVALGSDTQGTHKEQNLLFVRHARGRKLESGVQKNRSIKPKIRWKAKGLPDVWQGQHQVLEVQQALNISCLRCGESALRFLRNGKPPVWGLFCCPFLTKSPYYISIRKTWRKAASTTCGRGCSTFPQKGTLSAKNYPNGGFSGTSPPPGRDFSEKIGRTLPF